MTAILAGLITIALVVYFWRDSIKCRRLGHNWHYINEKWWFCERCGKELAPGKPLNDSWDKSWLKKHGLPKEEVKHEFHLADMFASRERDKKC